MYCIKFCLKYPLEYYVYWAMLIFPIVIFFIWININNIKAIIKCITREIIPYIYKNIKAWLYKKPVLSIKMIKKYNAIIITFKRKKKKYELFSIRGYGELAAIRVNDKKLYFAKDIGKIIQYSSKEISAIHKWGNEPEQKVIFYYVKQYKLFKILNRIL